MELEQLPDYFKCPISLETMSDPVILTSGHTFDRSSIENWLNSGHRTCPVTKLPLPPCPTLIPNLALRNLISRFSGAGDPVTVTLPSPRLQSLVTGLSFPSDLQTISQIHLITISNPTFCKYLANSGKITVLLQHLNSPDAEVRELALRAVLQISLDADEIKVGLVADGAVDHVAGVLFSGGSSSTSSCRSLAATILTSLAVADVNKCTIGAHSTAVSGLVSLLKNGKEREKKEAATAVYVLCSVPENRKRVVGFGAVPVLVELASKGIDRAVEVLGLLGKCREGLAEMKGMVGFVGLMAGVLRRGKARGVEHALTVLEYVCADGEGTREEVWKEGVLDLALGLSRRDDRKVGKNAARLVGTLHRTGFESLL